MSSGGSGARGRGFEEFHDAEEAESLRLARRVIRGLSLSMKHVVVAPGSRSAPLAYALAEAETQGELQVHMRIDERSAAFTALGIALSTGRPVGVLTTSGTAVGNLLPAVMEADMSAVPLVAITADRPENLHGTGANQTVWQQGSFSGRVRDELHLEQGQVQLDATSRDDLLAPENQAALLMHAALGEGIREAPGPVHLNVAFTEPLVPAPWVAEGSRPVSVPRWAPRLRTDPRVAEENNGGAGLSSHSDPGTTREDSGSAASAPTRSLSTGGAAKGAAAGNGVDSVRAAGFRDGAPETEPESTETFRTVFVLGHDAPASAVALAQKVGHPMLAEPTSGARSSQHGSVQAYPLLLNAEKGTAAADLREQTQRVVVAGRPTLTRGVQRLISAPGVQAVQYEPSPVPWHDERLPRPVIRSLQELASWAGQPETDWQQRWSEAGLAAQRAVDAVLQQDAQLQGLSSVRAAQVVAETVGTPLLLGSSSVIRDVDLSAVLTSRAAGTYAMRGLAGIDGNVSAAVGLSLGLRRRVTALVGDLTLLHDTNALLVPASEQPPNLDIVVINDAGGAIFDLLEHGQVSRRSGMAAAVERLFGTPQTVDFEALADAHHLEYRFVESAEALTAALADPEDRLGLRLIEVRTDRGRLRDLHSCIAAKAAELWGEELG